jgi:hypothetical protein
MVFSTGGDVMEFLIMIAIAYYIAGALFATLSFDNSDDAGSLVSWTHRMVFWPVVMWRC